MSFYCLEMERCRGKAGNIRDHQGLTQGRDPKPCICDSNSISAGFGERERNPGAERLWGGQGGWGAGDARSSLLAEPCGTLLPAGLPAWALARSHPARCQSMAIQMALVPSTRSGDMLGQGGVPSTTPDGLRHPLR